jgi:4a-hydroxytetrahydrobiopterin dehydratase
MAEEAHLASRKCIPCEGGVAPLRQDEVTRLLKQLQGWESVGGKIAKTYSFQNYYQTMAFVNAAAWISHREDHHPDMTVGYNKCRVEYMTHQIGGLSENDFICAAKLDRLFEL